MTAKPAGLPALSRTAVGREVIIQDFLPSLAPAFRILVPFVNVGVDAGVLTSENADEFGNERAKELLSSGLTHYLAWTGLREAITPDDLNSLIEETTIATQAYLDAIANEFRKHMDSDSDTEEPTTEEEADNG